MGKKIIKHPGTSKNSTKQKIINKMKLKFPRMERNFPIEEVPSEEYKFYSWPDDKKMVRLKGTLADEGFINWGEEFINSFFEECLDHVLYRSLKLIYGFPDPLTFLVTKEEVTREETIDITGMPTEWGYLIQGNGKSCFEIFKRHRDSSPKITLWLNTKNRPEEISNEIKNGLREFMKILHNLVVIVDREYNIEQELESSGQSIQMLTNLYYENFQSGNDILALSDMLLPGLKTKHDDLFDKGEFDESFTIYRKTRFSYVSSIIFFLMALEGFINLIYSLLLKPEFYHKNFKRSVWQSDIEMRILHLPVYCQGFTNAVITPESEVYKKWLSIRNFRNDLIHANITKENEAVATFEDGFFFTYNPLYQIKDRNKIKHHTSRYLIEKDDVLNLMETVKIIVSGIIKEMDEDFQIWTNTWINEPFVKREIKRNHNIVQH
jgi:hypothetical protein